MRNGPRWHPVWCVTLLLAAVGLFARVVPSAQGTADARFVELAKTSLSQIDGTLVMTGLRDTVEVSDVSVFDPTPPQGTGGDVFRDRPHQRRNRALLLVRPATC